jgi:hypothetical protein
LGLGLSLPVATFLVAHLAQRASERDVQGQALPLQ